MHSFGWTVSLEKKAKANCQQPPLNEVWGNWQKAPKTVTCSQQQVGPIRCQPASSGTSLVQCLWNYRVPGHFFIWNGSPGSTKWGCWPVPASRLLNWKGWPRDHYRFWRGPARDTSQCPAAIIYIWRTDLFTSPPFYIPPTHLSACS